MLTYSLRHFEALLITLPDGRVVRLTVADVDRGRCRIGVSAPADVKILRQELIADRPTPKAEG